MSTGSAALTGPLRRPPGRPLGPPARRAVAALLCVLSVLATGLLAPAAATSASAAGRSAAADVPDQGDAGPLSVRIDSLSPAVLPLRGPDAAPVVLRGTVTNTETDPWRDVNVYPWVSTTPLTTSDELADASRTPYAAEVGTRLTDDGTYAEVGDLAPGESADFTVTVPRDTLPIADTPGVYWIGAHALGTSVDGRDTSADGRARTFVPLVDVDAATSPVAASFVLPLRQDVRRLPDGRLADPQAWSRLLADDGRLGRLAGLGRSAGDFPVTLLLDPAVLDAATVLARRQRGGTDSAESSDPATAGRSSTPGDGTAAGRWLGSVVALAQSSRTLALGYGDPDVASLARRGPALLSRSRQLSQQSLAARGVQAAIPTVAPVDGVLPGSAFDVLRPSTQVLLSRRVAPAGTDTSARTAQGQPLALVDTDATGRGPGPGPVDDALAYRQRILAEGAVRELAAGSTNTTDGSSQGPMVVAPPAGWDPGSSWDTAAFFSSLQVPWLRWTPLDPGGATVLDDPTYPASAARRQVGDRLVGATRSTVRAGDTLAATLQRPGGTADA